MKLECKERSVLLAVCNVQCVQSVQCATRDDIMSLLMWQVSVEAADCHTLPINREDSESALWSKRGSRIVGLSWWAPCRCLGTSDSAWTSPSYGRLKF
ncbi:hypothetical protein J6590_065927 [Homalodisca vitripennis]|nr:hypothetical protein J6590_065927 [Homalodisca vitripennis]